jgi:hypothetical protein
MRRQVTSNWQSSERRAAQLRVKDFDARDEDFIDHRSIERYRR